MTLEKGQPIRIKPATFHRVPFNRLKHLRGKVGTVRRVIGREAGSHPERVEGRALVEVEVGGGPIGPTLIGVCWDFEVKAIGEKP